jgi:hypothetical protein
LVSASASPNSASRLSMSDPNFTSSGGMRQV